MWYTFGMHKSMPNVKTAISLKQGLFREVDKIAHELKVSRSRVFVLALEAYVSQYQNRLLLEKINQSVGDISEGPDKRKSQATKRSHRKIVEGEW